MQKTNLGIVFVATGLVYSSLAIDKINQATLGLLIKNGWLEAPSESAVKKSLFFGPKLQIIFYSICLVAIGLYLIFTKQI